MRTWQDELERAHRRFVVCIYLSLLISPLVFGAVVGIFGIPTADAATGVAALITEAILALLISSIPAIYTRRKFVRVRDRDPERNTSGVSGARQSAGAPVSLDLAPRWWGEVSGNGISGGRNYGDEGEEAFLWHLKTTLPDGYIAVRNLLVSRSLDADLILVGPTGIWVFEVKHWSGEIVCSGGQWSQRRSYYESGGYLKQEERQHKPVDQQWIREGNAVAETLRRRAPRVHGDRMMQGGLVFPHRNASLNIDDSCRAPYGNILGWDQVIRDAPEVPWFTVELRLQVLDALLKWADRLQEGEQNPSYATELAARIFDRATSDAQSYVRT